MPVQLILRIIALFLKLIIIGYERKEAASIVAANLGVSTNDVLDIV